MKSTWFWMLAASVTVAGIGLEAMPAAAAGETTATAVKPAAVTPKPRELGGAMPLPVDQRITRENKPADKLVVEVTKSAAEGTHYVAYVKIAWGDLDNLIKGTGPQYYSDWDGSLTIAGGTGAIDEKIQFDSGGAAKKPATGKAPVVAKAARGDSGPGQGSGRDQVEIASGPVVDWKAGVVGVVDGLRIKITSPTATIHATLVAGKFTVPITIAAGTPAVAHGLVTPVSPNKKK